MSTVISPDGTIIDHARYGDGPAVVFVAGAATYRAIDEGTTQTVRRLAAGGFTTVEYDRRGRGRSGDTPPWVLDREVEDIHGRWDGARARVGRDSRGRPDPDL